jgi:uncharacterized membrane protein YhhN
LSTPIVLCAIAVGALLAAEWHQWLPGCAVAKLTASSAFVWLAVERGALGSSYGVLLLVGLGLCWCGDALLLSPGRTRTFQLGIGAFLLGHVAYAAASTRLDLHAAWLAACGLAAAVGGALVQRWLQPHLPSDFRVPVLAYVCVIAAMLAFAGAASLSGGPALLGIGAFGFAASDLSVARERFVAPSFANGAWGLPAYFASQLAIAWTAGSLP